MKYVADFEEWALEKYRQFKKAQESNLYLIDFVSPGRAVIIINLKNEKTSLSKCHPCDKFDTCIGLGIAWARYLGEEIPKQAIPITISKLTPGERFVFINGIYSDKKFYYIGYDPVNNAAVAVCANTGENHLIDLNRHVIKI